MSVSTRVQLFSQFESDLSVLRLADQLETQTGPIDFAADACPDLLLVVGQKDTIGVHNIPPCKYEQYNNNQLGLQMEMASARSLTDRRHTEIVTDGWITF